MIKRILLTAGLLLLAVAGFEAPFPECPPSGCKLDVQMIAEAPFPECPPSGCKFEI